mgnify:CR=1 FL=1
MARTKRTKETPWGTFIKGWLAEECCGQPMNAGYDVVWVVEFDFEGEENAYYRMCDVCGTSEARRYETLRASFEYDYAREQRLERDAYA